MIKIRKKTAKEHIWAQLSEMPGILIVLTDTSFVLEWANGYFYTYFDCLPNAVLGKPMYSFLGEDARGDMSEEHISNVLLEKHKWDYYAQTYGADGEFVIIRWFQQVFSDEKGKSWILSLGLPPGSRKEAAVEIHPEEWESGETVPSKIPDIVADSVIDPAEEIDIRRQLSTKSFLMHYQPRVNARSKAIDGAEALVRLMHPERGILYPPSFLPISEKTGQILDIGTYVVEHACKKLQEWQNQTYGTLSMSVNISSAQIKSENFVQSVISAINQYRVEPHQLILEFTELTAAANFDEMKWIIKALRDSGFNVSLDDYKAEFLSPSLLINLPVNNITIHRDYLINADNNPSLYAIMESIIVLAHGLNITVTAGGIENRRQLDFLLNNAVDFLQGYLISEPLPEEEFDIFLKTNPDFYTRHI